MSPQSAPEQKQPIYRLPEVPEYRKAKLPGSFYRVAYTLICLAAVLLIVWIGFKGTFAIAGIVFPKATLTPVAHPTPTRPTVQLSSNEISLLQQYCPDASLLATPALVPINPTLDFCSPKYYGNVGGPVGSHLTLIGEDMPAGPEKWALVNDVERPVLNDVKTLQVCLGQKKLCSLLPAPDKTEKQPTFSLYSWTWLPPQFPTLDNTNYYIVADSPDSSQLLWSSIAFTLNSAQAPCISISKKGGNSSGDCTKKRDFSLTVGDTIKISGSNWILKNSSNQQPIQVFVQIIISCRAGTQCSTPTLPISSALVGTDGSFTTSFDISAQDVGIYMVTASCQQVPQIATPGLRPTSLGNINTIVNGVLTFGSVDDATSLTLHIGENTHPG